MAGSKTTKTTKPARSSKGANGDEMQSVNLRIPASLLETIDAIVESANASDPERWPRMTRLDWMRNALARAAKADGT